MSKLQDRTAMLELVLEGRTKTTRAFMEDRARDRALLIEVLEVWDRSHAVRKEFADKVRKRLFDGE